MAKRHEEKLGFVLKELLNERSWSMGKLSELTQIDKATISKIISGKRKANLQHLQKFADCFDGVPINELIAAAGYDIEQKNEKITADAQPTIENMQLFLESTNLYDKKLKVEDVKHELAKYEQFARTEEGRDTIHNGFEEKLKRVDSVGPYIKHLKDLYEHFRLKKGSAREIALAGGALLYFILTLDIIPDYIFPVGYLDDAIAVQVVLNILKEQV